MFSKLFKKLLSETTNIADTTAVTFNTSGNYNPKYGKQKVYVSGRGGTGTTTPGNYFDNSYSNAGSYTPASYTPGSYYQTGYSYYGYADHYAQTYNHPSGNWYAYENAYAAVYTVWGINVGNSQYSSPIPAVYSGPYPGSSNPIYFASQIVSSGAVGNTSPASYTPASYTPGNYVPGNTGTYATNYTTGTAANILGITFPGGVGGAATVVPATLITNPKYGTTTTVTIPTGGYATITFTL